MSEGNFPSGSTEQDSRSPLERMYGEFNRLCRRMPSWLRIGLLALVAVISGIMIAPDVRTGLDEIFSWFPQAVIGPIEPKILFATNRDRVAGKFVHRLSREGPQWLDYGWADRPGENVRIEVPPIFQVENRSSALVRVYSPLERMAGHLADGPCLSVIFVPDHALDLEDSLSRALRIKEKTVSDANWMVFAWPTMRWKETGLLADRDNARSSGVALARLWFRIRSLSRNEDEVGFRCRLAIVTEGMGAYVLRQAVQAIRGSLNDEPLPILADEIVLIAANEDDDAFEHDHKLRLLPHLARRVTVYANRNDDVLALGSGIESSKRLQTDALGQFGPRLADALPRKIELVDVTNGVRDTAVMHHGYATEAEVVVRDLTAILKGGSIEAFVWRRYDERCRCFGFGFSSQ